MTDISYSKLKQHQARLDELLAAVRAANDALTAYIRAEGDDFSRIDDYSAGVRKALQVAEGDSPGVVSKVCIGVRDAI